MTLHLAQPCTECSSEFDWMKHFTQERSGEQYNREFGQTEYWFAGTVECPNCGASWGYSDSSL